MGIGCHDGQSFYRLDVECDIGCIAIALVRIREDECIYVSISVEGVTVSVCRIDVAVVGTVVLRPAGIVLYIPVRHHHTVHCLVVDELSGDGHRERNRESVVYRDGALPYLRHLELRVYGLHG